MFLFFVSANSPWQGNAYMCGYSCVAQMVPVMSKENMYLTVTDVVCHVVFVCIDISEGMYNCVEIQKAIQSAFCSLVLSFQPSDLKCNK